MKQTYRNMMEQVTLSDNARSSFREKLTRKKCKPGRPLRTALIAASLCGILTGTVFAVDYVGRELLRQPKGSVEITAIVEGEDISSYKVKAAPDLNSRKTLAPVVKDALSKEGDYLSFRTKGELESYLGVKLPINPLLDNGEIVDDVEKSIELGWKVCPELALDSKTPYLLTAVYSDEGDGNAELVRVTFHRVVDNTEVYVRAYLPLNVDEETIIFPGETFYPASLIENNLVRKENGEFEWESEQYSSAKKQFYTEEYLMDNGEIATIVTSKTAYRTKSKEPDCPEYTAYFVSDGILFSVNAYAVHDPDKDHPNSMMTVLTRVLDEFR